MTRSAGRIRRKINEKEQAGLVASVARVMTKKAIVDLELEKKVPPFCVRMGWPAGPTVDGVCLGHAFVARVLAHYFVGAIEDRFPVPEYFKTHARWSALCLQFGPAPSTAAIVECMSPDETGPAGHPDRLDSLIGIESKRETVARAPKGTLTRGGYVQ